MAYIRRFILMMQFLTTLPVKVNVQAGREDFGKGLAMAPLVGLVIGALMAGFNYLIAMLFPPLVAAVLTMAVYILLTGGLHMDGLGDTADGIFSNRPAERILEIMKDSRVGTNAVIALVLIILADISLIASFEKSEITVVLLLMPVAGRIGSLVGAGTSRYAGKSDSPGRWSVEYCGRMEIIIGLALYIIIIIAAMGIFAWPQAFSPARFAEVSRTVADSSLVAAGLPPIYVLFPATVVIPPLTSFILARLLGKKLGGVTGDILGAICEINQVIFLFTAYLFV
jgi:adenosylcobinamide-GDP ribazoletransferase